jgi:hypothetical protein
MLHPAGNAMIQVKSQRYFRRRFGTGSMTAHLRRTRSTHRRATVH